MLPKLLLYHKYILGGYKMKYKVLKDHQTADGILYKGEIVKEHENKPNGHIRVKDNMGRIWFVPKNILERKK